MPTAGSIGELPFFSGLSHTEIGDIESRMRRREYALQQTIVRESGPGLSRLKIDPRVLTHRPQQDHRVRRHPPRPEGRDDRARGDGASGFMK